MNKKLFFISLCFLLSAYLPAYAENGQALSALKAEAEKIPEIEIPQFPEPEAVSVNDTQEQQIKNADNTGSSLIENHNDNTENNETNAIDAEVQAQTMRMADPELTRLSGEELFQYLHAKVQPPYTNQIHSYSEAKSYMYGVADNQGCNGGAGILTFYSQICAPGSSYRGDDYKEQGDANQDGFIDNYINAEHIWPQSFFGKQLPMVADLHHLQSTYGTPNNRRSNFKFAYVRPEEAYYSTSSGSRSGKAKYEPCDAVKGNVARSMLYFITRYYDRNIRQKMNYQSFWTDNVEMFLKWNRQDPPDDREIERNNRIEKFQGNRNPFVDDYTLADRIGASVWKSH